MKKKIIFFLGIFFSIISLHLRSQVLIVPEVIQEQDQWCWAGSSSCVLDYYCTPTSQCTIAEYTREVATWHDFGSVNCCTDPTQGCNYWNYNWGYAGSIQDILVHFASAQNNGISSYLSMSVIHHDLWLKPSFYLPLAVDNRRRSFSGRSRAGRY